MYVHDWRFAGFAQGSDWRDRTTRTEPGRVEVRLSIHRAIKNELCNINSRDVLAYRTTTCINIFFMSPPAGAIFEQAFYELPYRKSASARAWHKKKIKTHRHQLHTTYNAYAHEKLTTNYGPLSGADRSSSIKKQPARQLDQLPRSLSSSSASYVYVWYVFVIISEKPTGGAAAFMIWCTRYTGSCRWRILTGPVWVISRARAPRTIIFSRSLCFDARGMRQRIFAGDRYN